MRTKIRKWGRGQGIRLSMHVLETAGIEIGDNVEIIAGQDEIIVRKPRAKKYDLAELISRLPRNYRGTEQAFGKPTGKEAW